MTSVVPGRQRARIASCVHGARRRALFQLSESDRHRHVCFLRGFSCRWESESARCERRCIRVRGDACMHAVEHASHRAGRARHVCHAVDGAPGRGAARSGRGPPPPKLQVWLCTPVDRTPERHLLVRVGIGQLRHFFPSPPARHAREPRGVAAFREGSPPSSSSPVVRDGAAPRLRFPCAQTRRESLPSSSTFPAERARRLQRAALAAACHPQGWTITLGSRGVPLGFISQLIALRLAGKHCPPVIGTPYRT